VPVVRAAAHRLRHDELDDFTLNLLGNDEVLALDQDALGKEATCVWKDGDLRVFEKELADGGRALGFFNLAATPATLDSTGLASLVSAANNMSVTCGGRVICAMWMRRPESCR